MADRAAPVNVEALRIVYGVIAVLGMGLLVAGGFGVKSRETGPRAKATVTECNYVSGGTKTGTDVCSGTWVTGGSLVGGKGHVIIGNIEGAESGDIGKTLNVRLSGNHAYTSSLRVPIILLAIGLITVLGSVLVIIKGGRRQSRPPRG
jgi:hypothetical protein